MLLCCNVVLYCDVLSYLLCIVLSCAVRQFVCVGVTKGLLTVKLGKKTFFCGTVWIPLAKSCPTRDLILIHSED